MEPLCITVATLLSKRTRIASPTWTQFPPPKGDRARKLWRACLCETHNVINLTETIECSRKCFRILGPCTWVFMQTPQGPKMPWHCRSHKTRNSASKAQRKAPAKFRPKKPATSVPWPPGKGSISIWSIQ